MKTVAIFFGVCCLTISVFAQTGEMRSGDLVIQIDPKTGGLQSIVNTKDNFSMNWLVASDGSQYPWQTSQLAWGLGFCKVDGQTVKWNSCSSMEFKDNSSVCVYQTKLFDLSVSRKITIDGDFSETYSFTNTKSTPITLSEMGIYTPFNDNYPDARTCIERQCNAHIWMGGHSSYVFAVRMGGQSPHLGLVLTAGSLDSYEILNRGTQIGSSNTRGTIVLNPEDITLAPKQTYTLGWTLFPCSGWEEFYTKAMAMGFVKASAQHYVVENDELLNIAFESAGKLSNVKCFLNSKTVDFKQADSVVKVTAKPQTTGDQIVKIQYGSGQSAFARLYRIENIGQLIKKRIEFIVDKQQCNDPNDRRDGAYMVYDNELKAIYKNDGTRKSEDTNEGRERIGMGVLIAIYLQSHPDAKLQYSVERYYDFVRNRLQKPDYKLFNDVADVKVRGYNYPWAAHFYLELYKLTGDKKYITDYFGTLRRYFQDFRYGFYGIGIPVRDGLKQLQKAGMKAEYDLLLNDFRQTADVFLKNSIYYPKSEVNYEQGIVAPSVVFLLEMYEVTKEQKYLDEAKKQMVLLEAFSGNQPDYHLNQIGIRHWDGYWFGKYQFFGDTLPHYWSTITAKAFTEYALITDSEDYLRRARTIVRNNLCSFFSDGSASCAYIYPAKVNSQKAAFFDPYANDQDWALVYYLECLATPMPMHTVRFRGDAGGSLTVHVWPDGYMLAKGASEPESLRSPERTDAIRITNVSHPTLTLYPAVNHSGPAPAMIVCPGGGYGLQCEREARV
jgi:hypothetical protein